jgi:LysM repeat protein
MSSYYKKINGKNYDRAMLEVADKGIQGQGDGRISLTDAKIIIKKAKDGGRITDIELRTLNYILEKYRFTEPALKYVEESLSDSLILKDKENSEQKKTEQKKAEPEKPVQYQEEYPKENKPLVQEIESKSSKLKYFIIFLLLLALAAFLFIKFFYKKDTGSTDSIPALNNEKDNEKDKKDKADDEKDKAEAAKIEAEKAEAAKKEAEKTEAAKKDAEKAEAAKKEAEKAEAAKNQYVVKPQDTLIKVSQTVYGDYKFWVDIYKANKNKIKNPALIYPGQVLTIPEKNK